MTIRSTPLLMIGVVLLCILLASPSRAADSWTQWRGPTGQGLSTAKDLPTSWSETENVAWRTVLPGKGWSSPVIEGNDIWLTTAIEFPSTPEQTKKRLEKNTGNQPLTVVEKVELRALCVDRTSGALRENILVLTEIEPEPVHQLNSYASPTPLLEDRRLYCHFGAYGTACLDTRSKKVVWEVRDQRVKHENGPGGSPVLWGKLLIFHCDGSDKQYIVALDKESGKQVWKTERTGETSSDPQLKKAYGTPLVVERGGKPVLVSPAANWVYGYDPATGKELWKVKYPAYGFSVVPRPVAGNDLVYCCTSFMQSQVIALKLGDDGTVKLEWSFGKQAPQMPSPVLVGDDLVMVSDKGVATCLDAKTGSVRWTERINGNYSASLLAADGKLYLMSREGITTVLAAGSTYKVLSTNKLDGQIMASPAALDGALYVRTDKALYCLRNGKGSGGSAAGK